MPADRPAPPQALLLRQGVVLRQAGETAAAAQ